MLSQKRDKPAAARFFTQAIGHAGLPEKIVIDKSGVVILQQFSLQ
jgi:putative transposase